MAGHSDEQVSDGADHEQQANGVTNEARYADQYPTDKDDEPIEQLSGRYLPAGQSFASVGEQAKADAADDERPEGARDDQDPEGPKEADLISNGHEGGDFRSDHEEHADEEHEAG